MRRRPGPTSFVGVPRRRRVLVAWALTILTALEALAVVVGVARGGGPELALVFFASCLLTGALGVGAWRGWAWVAATPDGAPRAVEPRPAGGTTRAADDYRADAEGDEPRPHLGLSGQVPPPTRW